MTKRLAGLLTLFIGCLSAAAAENDEAARTAKTKAEECAQATVKGDFGKLLDLTYPRIVEMGGGKQRLLAQLEAQAADWKKRGFEFRSAKVGAPSQVVAGDRELFAVVPMTLVLKVPEGTLTLEGFLLGISSDQGKTWTFIDGNKAGSDEVKKMLPALPAALRLPEKKQPVFEKNR